MMYSRLERRVAPVDDGSTDSPFTMPLEERVQNAARRTDECEQETSSDHGVIATVLLVTGGFLGLVTYLGMYGP
jgi:hypothetical protein